MHIEGFLILFIIYLPIPLTVATIGEKRKMGYWLSALLCVLLTPIIGWLIVYFSKPLDRLHPQQNNLITSL
jgi:uncharacterized membrane protein